MYICTYELLCVCVRALSKYIEKILSTKYFWIRRLFHTFIHPSSDRFPPLVPPFYHHSPRSLPPSPPSITCETKSNRHLHSNVIVDSFCPFDRPAVRKFPEFSATYFDLSNFFFPFVIHFSFWTVQIQTIACKSLKFNIHKSL